LRVFPPLFNQFEGGQSFGSHVDNAIRQVPGVQMRIRTDLSATLFLAEPDEYDGERTLLFDLDAAIQRVSAEMPAHPAAVQLTSVYHNLLRRWADL